jgi:hypothetical protein
VIAAATATRVMPSAARASSRSSVIPPMANTGRGLERAAAARNAGVAWVANALVAEG